MSILDRGQLPVRSRRGPMAGRDEPGAANSLKRRRTNFDANLNPDARNRRMRHAAHEARQARNQIVARTSDAREAKIRQAREQAKRRGYRGEFKIEIPVYDGPVSRHSPSDPFHEV
jgi:hypothetical protein